MGGINHESASYGTAGPGSGAHDAGHVVPKAWAPLAKPGKRRLKHPAPEDAMRMVRLMHGVSLPTHMHAPKNTFGVTCCEHNVVPTLLQLTAPELHSP